MISMARLLARVLRLSGVDCIYGSPLGGLPVVVVEDQAVASLLASAHTRVHRGRAAAHLGDGVLHVPGRGDRESSTLLVTDEDEVVAAAAVLWAGGEVTISLVADPETPVADRMPVAPASGGGWADPDAGLLEQLDGSGSLALLVGPGVVAGGEVDALHELAGATGVGVLNTWGAKGVFDWRSRHHLATVGLQELDFELGDLGRVDLIVAAGLDPREAPEDRWKLAPAAVVDPSALGGLAHSSHRVVSEPAVPPLRHRLGRLTQEGWQRDGGPLAPSRITLNYSRWLAGSGLVAADAGTSGFWVARTLSTTRPRSVVVPAERCEGFAAAAVLAARLRKPWARALAVIDGPLGASTGRVLEAASSLGVAIPIEMWDREGEELDADDHSARLQRLTLDDTGGTVSLAADGHQLERVLDAAGPIIAWS